MSPIIIHIYVFYYIIFYIYKQLFSYSYILFFTDVLLLSISPTLVDLLHPAVDYFLFLPPSHLQLFLFYGSYSHFLSPPHLQLFAFCGGYFLFHPPPIYNFSLSAGGLFNHSSPQTINLLQNKYIYVPLASKNLSANQKST